MTVLQKAVLPRMTEAYLRGFDRVAGFVVAAADVAWARTPADLFVAHGLGFPGSPVTADTPYVDVLRFEPVATTRTVAATGGVDQESRGLTGGTFVDRPPFTGTGFVAAPGHVVPLWWLMHTRVPAGAELWRVHADGREELLAVYPDVATGWAGPAVAPVGTPQPRLSRHVGPLAQWHGATLTASVVGTDVVLAATSAPPAELGFEPTAVGRWRRVVPMTEVDALFELVVTARWNGLEMRVVDEWDEQGTQMSHLFYVGHDADLAEGLRLTKLDAAVYETSAPSAQLSELTHAQTMAPGWPGA